MCCRRHAGAELYALPLPLPQTSRAPCSTPTSSPSIPRPRHLLGCTNPSAAPGNHCRPRLRCTVGTGCRAVRPRVEEICPMPCVVVPITEEIRPAPPLLPRTRLHRRTLAPPPSSAGMCSELCAGSVFPGFSPDSIFSGTLPVTVAASDVNFDFQCCL
jgi:hypothetical protein